MKKLAILGASYLQKPLVDKAKAMGIETHCFAWDAEDSICKDVADKFYPISVLEKEVILQKCKEIDVDGIVTIATDVCVPTISFVANEMNLTGNSIASALVSTNKAKMKQAFIRNKINTPVGKKVKEYNQKDFSHCRFPLIVKPADRSGSRGINKVNNLLDLKKCIEIALKESFNEEAIVEEYIEGTEVSVESISWKGEHFILAITDKVTTGEPHFVELEHHQPSQLDYAIQEKIRIETQRCLDALLVENGAGHSEFKIDDKGEVFVIEVGARMGGDFIGSNLVHLSTGYDYLRGTIEVALGKLKKPLLPAQKFSGVFFLCKETEHLLSVMKTYQSFPEIIKAEIFDKELKPVKSSGDRSGYLIYQAQKKTLY
jgi:biotin carboxylase